MDVVANILCFASPQPPAGYKQNRSKKYRKIYIPQEEYPDINFMGECALAIWSFPLSHQHVQLLGLIIGPRGSSLKKLEARTGAKVMIRGRGSEKEGKRRDDGPGADDKMHCMISADNEEVWCYSGCFLTTHTAILLLHYYYGYLRLPCDLFLRSQSRPVHERSRSC